MCDPEVLPLGLFEGAVVILVGQAEEEPIPARFERLVEWEILQPIQVTVAHGHRAARILGAGSQNLDHRIVVLVPEGADGGLVSVDYAVLERGPNRRRDPLLNEGRVPDDGLIHGSPIRSRRREQGLRHRVEERIRGDLTGCALDAGTEQSEGQHS
jgi:hypothetical protein